MKLKIFKLVFFPSIVAVAPILTACDQQKTVDQFKFNSSLQNHANFLWKIFGFYTFNHNNNRFDTSGKAFSDFFKNDGGTLSTIINSLSFNINQQVSTYLSNLNFTNWSGKTYDTPALKQSVKQAYLNQIDMILFLALIVNAIYVNDDKNSKAAIKRINDNFVNIQPDKSVLEWLLNVINQSTSLSFVPSTTPVAFDKSFITKFYSFIKTLFNNNSANAASSFTKLIQSNFLPGAFTASTSASNVPELTTTSKPYSFTNNINSVDISIGLNLQLVTVDMQEQLQVTNLNFSNLFA